MMPESILIVNEDRNLRQSMALILRRASYQVDTAGTSADALTDLKKRHYDLVIVDLMTPFNGAILLPNLLSLYPSQAILVLTSQASPESDCELVHGGLHSRLNKPVTPEALLERVKAILTEQEEN
jgi:DNA-binding response OmpR family regulator